MIDLSYRDINGEKRELQETANSYVIHESGNYCIPLIYGCGIKDGKNNIQSYTREKSRQLNFFDYQDNIISSFEIPYKACGVKLISWDSKRDLITKIRVDSGYLKFDVSDIPNDGGNYVIGIVDNLGKVIWSWHIWLWKNCFKDIKVTKTDLLLDTNLATKGDKSWFYQFGRKDPLSCYNKRILVHYRAKSVGQAIQNPNIFFTGRSYFSDLNWVELDHDLCNFWNASGDEKLMKHTIKTIYDPCPPGYKVPSYSVFNNLKIGDKKMNFKTRAGDKLVLPICGYRNYYTGRLAKRDVIYWSSSIKNIYSGCGFYEIYGRGKNKLFHSNWGVSRASALPIRPQKML